MLRIVMATLPTTTEFSCTFSLDKIKSSSFTKYTPFNSSSIPTSGPTSRPLAILIKEDKEGLLVV